MFLIMIINNSESEITDEKVQKIFVKVKKI